MAADDIRVTIPDVGGGFGTKAPDYPETFLVAQAARMLGRPVRWMAERGEGMLSDNAGRDLEHDLTLAFDADLRVTAYRVDTRCNLGAYNSGLAQPIQTVLFSKVLTGPYDIPAAFQHVEGYFTNTTQVDAYRGAGRPEAIYALERAMDRAARELGVDGWELRRRNFIPPEQFPYTTVSGETYDVGDFARLLSRAADKADWPGFAARNRPRAARGRLRGMGLGYYIESILGNPSETAKVTFAGGWHRGDPCGHAVERAGARDGLCPVPVGPDRHPGRGDPGGAGRQRPDRAGRRHRRVALGDHAEQCHAGHRGRDGRGAFAAYLAEKAGVDRGEVTFDDETFRVPGSNLTPTCMEAAEMARAEGRDDLLEHEETATLPGRSYPNGAMWPRSRSTRKPAR